MDHSLFTPRGSVRLAGATAVVLGLLVGPAAAVDVPFGSEVVDSGTADTPWNVQVADMDGDGDLDALSASIDDDELNWFENDGATNPGFTPHTITTTATGATSIFPADVDGDGDMDVVGAQIFGDTIAWYENDGASPPAFTERIVDDTIFGARTVYASDVDVDGDVDLLLAADFAGEVLWYENDGASPPGFTRRVVDANAPTATSVFPIDVDRDGDIDLLATSELDGTLAFHENDGLIPPGFTESPVDTNSPAALWTRAADVDGDGDIDPVLASVDDDLIAFFGNDGSAPPTFSKEIVSNVEDGARSVGIADVDGDGDLDVFSAAEFDDLVSWFENTGGSPPAFVRHEITASALGASSVVAGDLDRDGDTDILSASFDDDTLRWYPNDALHGTADYAAAAAIDALAAGASGVASADLDGDGDPDVAATSADDDTVAWYQSDGASPPAFVRTVVSATAAGASDVAVADVDRDGDVDLAVTTADDDGLTLWTSDGGSPPVFSASAISSAADGASAVAVADVDGDGDLDLLSASAGDDTVAWWENDGLLPAGFTQRLIATTAVGASDVTTADLDSDGDTDVVAASAGDDSVTWFENDGGSPPLFTPAALSTTETGASGVAVADLDRDGDLDVLATAEGSGAVAWFENDGGSPPGFTRRPIDAALAGARSVASLDVDRDGHPDVVAAGATGSTVAWYQSDSASPPAFTRRDVDTALAGASAVAPADLDRDGHPDLLAAATGASVVWYREQGGQAALDGVVLSDPLVLQGEQTGFFAFDLVHQGLPQDGDAELSAIAFRFEDDQGVPLDDATVNALVDAVTLYVDDGSGDFDPLADTVLDSLASPLPLDQGVTELFAPDGDPAVQVTTGGSVTFFVSVTWDAAAAGANGVPLQLRLLTNGSGSQAQDPRIDAPLRLAVTPEPLAEFAVVDFLPACVDGIDNDGDGLTDYEEDPGCLAAASPLENPQCDDGIDNDGDGLTDFGEDPQCDTAWDDAEQGSSCGLLGIEALGVLLALVWRRRRGRA